MGWLQPTPLRSTCRQSCLMSIMKYAPGPWLMIRAEPDDIIQESWLGQPVILRRTLLAGGSVIKS